MKINPKCEEEGHQDIPDSNMAYTRYTCYREGCEWEEYDPPLDQWPGAKKTIDNKE